VLPGSELAGLLEYLRANRGFDFTGYKPASLDRRINKRMAMVGSPSYADYEDYLEVHPDEFTELFNTILINVTSFFRDRLAWEYLEAEVVPELMADLAPDQPIRVWSAACASGEEAYSAAIVLAEALGVDEFRERVKVYGTDVDEDALSAARHATYPREALKDVPDELVERYFEPTASGLSFRPDLRRTMIFGRNDLVQDAPISRVDLLVSRNTLMYFTAETQARILGHFNFSLNEHGFLFLGKSEMLVTHADLFTPHSLKWRVFRKVPGPVPRERVPFLAQPHPGRDGGGGRNAEIRVAAADVGPVPQLVVDRAGFVASINHAARAQFGLGAAEVGRPFQDLELSYRPVELRGAIEQAYDKGHVVDLGRTEWAPPGQPRLILRVTVAPVVSGAGATLGAVLSFEDVTALARLDVEHQAARRRAETAYEELQSTIEELETTNEELQSTNEELETTNEELQSTNEELETMNEELTSSNDELETMNEEQRSRAIELDRLNLFLEGILGILGLGVVVLDPEQHVQLWNPAATEMWGLHQGEVLGQHFLELDIGLPVHELREVIRDALAEQPASGEIELEAINRRGRTFPCSIRVLPLRDSRGESRGVIVLMSDGPVARLVTAEAAAGPSGGGS
jgi:two-component system CheB/CheR fusion protein